MSTALFQAPRLIFLNHSLPVEPSDLESSGSDIAGRSRAFSRKLSHMCLRDDEGLRNDWLPGRPVGCAPSRSHLGANLEGCRPEWISAVIAVYVHT